MSGSLCVRVPVADLWIRPDPAPGVDEDRATQLLLGAPLAAIQESDGALYVEGPDGYRGWIRREDTAAARTPAADAEWMAVGDLVAPIFAGPETGSPCGEVFFGTRLPADDTTGGRRRVLLPEGEGWIAAAALRPPPAPAGPLPAERILADARRFIGTPYLWGGGTCRGIDCSGFVQLLFAMHGRPLRRDADLQTRHGVAVPPDALQPGDLLFFGSCRWSLPTHVGIYAGAGEYIHAHGSGGHCVEIGAFPETLAAGTFWGARRLE